MKKALLAILLLLVLCVTGVTEFGARGVVEAESVEWKTMDSPLIVRGKVVASKDSTPGLSSLDGRITIAVSEILRGTWDEKELEVFTQARPDDSQARNWLKSGHELLFFLRPASARDYRELAGKWVLREGLAPVFDLVEPQQAYGADMTILQDGEKILERVRLWTGRSSRLVEVGKANFVKVGGINVALPPELAGRNEKDRGFMYLMVPGEEKYRGKALGLIGSEIPQVRVQGVWMMANLPEDEETTKLLNNLLYDSGEVSYSGYELGDITYPVRDAAWSALICVGHKPETPKPDSKRKPTEAEKQKVRVDWWSKAIADTLGKDWQLTSLELTPAPPGWTRQQGADGFVLQCRKGPAEKATTLTIYVMPKNSRSTPSAWVAYNKYYYLNDLMQRSFRKPGVTNPPDDKSATYLGVKPSDDCHVFVPPQTPAELRQMLVKAWRVKIHRDY